LLRVLEVNLGVRREKADKLRIDPSSQYSNRDKRNAYFDEMLRRARSVPGVSAAGLTDVLPLGGDRSWGVGVKGVTYAKGQIPEAFVRIVSEGYFEATGIPLRAGRFFTARDTPNNEKVIVINETLARTLWPGQNAIGQVMSQDGGRRVIGIVADVRHHERHEQRTDRWAGQGRRGPRLGSHRCVDAEPARGAWRPWQRTDLYDHRDLHRRIRQRGIANDDGARAARHAAVAPVLPTAYCLLPTGPCSNHP